MKISEARYKANKKWNTANYEQINLSVPKGTKDPYKQYAESAGLSLAELMTTATDEYIEHNPIPAKEEV